MANPTAYYFHFRNDRDETGNANKRVDCLKDSLLGWLFDDSELTTPIADYLPARKERELGKSESPSIWFCHITPLATENRLEQLIEASFGDGISQRYVALVSGQAIVDSDWIKTSIAVGKDKGFGGFTYLPVGLDDGDKTELKAILYRIRSLFEEHGKAGTSPTPEAFDAAIHIPHSDFVQEAIERLVQCASFDKKRHGRFAAKLLNRLQNGKTIAGELKKEHCIALADFISHLAKFEGCRSRLSHATLTDLETALRQVYETKTMPEDYPYCNDRGCVGRLMKLIIQPPHIPSLFSDSQAMLDAATAISESKAIRDVIRKLNAQQLSSDVRFFRAECLKRIEAGWASLKAKLASFPKWQVGNDEAWLDSISTESLESARTVADEYQRALASHNFYQEQQ